MEDDILKVQKGRKEKEKLEEYNNQFEHFAFSIVVLKVEKIIKEFKSNGNKEPLNYNYYVKLHEKLFDNIYPEIAGEVRMSGQLWKSEPLLNGRTVKYATGKELLFEGKSFLDNFEKELQNKEKDKEEQVGFFIQKIKNIWQKHYFFEGNTRTTALYCDLMSIKHNLPFRLLDGDIKELRNAFVLAAEKQEYAKLYEYFNKHTQNQNVEKKNPLLEKMQARRAQEENSHYRGLKK